MKMHATGARAIKTVSLVLFCGWLFASANCNLRAAQIVIGDPIGGQFQPQTLNSSSVGTVTPQADGSLKWIGTTTVLGQYKLDWDLTLDADPFVSGTLTQTNLANVTSAFSVSVLQPASPAVLAGANMQGSSSVQVQDANGDSAATLSALAGSSLYTATLDGIAQRQLYATPYSLSPALAFPGATNSDTRNFGLESTTLPLTSLIGITHTFSLTAGDLAQITSSFVVTVPEPASLSLAIFSGLGLMALGVRRSR